MPDQLIQLDYQLFIAINKGLSNPFFDWLMPFLRNRFFWAPLYLFLGVFFIRNYKLEGWILILFLLITLAMADYLSGGLLKPIFERLRPCYNPDLKLEINSLVNCDTGFSFPSAQAANYFSIATFLITVFYTRWKWILPLTLAWAVSIAFAQVYAGVHFPFDVVAGAFIGSLIGYVTGTVYLTLFSYRIWQQ